MIRLYDKEERVFDHLGIGSLSDVASAIVIEELNGSFEMEFEYPVIGKHLDDIKQRNIVVCKPNMHTDKQAFRIFEITKPFNGFITVRAEHVTYDASGIIVLPLWDRTDESETGARQIISFGNKIDRVDSETGVTKSGYLLSTIFNGGNVEGAPVASGINDAIILKNKDPLMQNPIRLVMGPQKIDEFKEDGFEIKMPSNLRSILGGSEDSLLEHFKGEYEFNNFEIIMHDRRGKDRDINIRYGKNMTDMEQETNSANLFTGLFPFYSKEYEESYVSEDEVFQKAYIRPGITALRTDWLSIEVSEQELKWGGIAMLPLVETMEMVFPKIVGGVETIVRKTYQRYAPVQVKTPGEFFDKIFVFNKAKAASGTSVDAYHTSVEKVDDVINVLALSLVKDGTTSIVPKYGVIYVIQNITAEFGKNSTLFGKKYIWDNGAYVLYDGNGFYKEALDATDATLINDDNPLPVPIPVEPIVYVNGEWVENEEDGSIYVEPKTIDRETHIIEKYKYVDLADYVIPEGESINTLLSEEGVIYVNEELKNLETQKILTLDLTQELDAIEDMEPEDMTPKMLFDKAEQYLKDHDLNRIKESVAVSFIKLSDDLEYEHLKQLEVVELGDDIHVIHEKLGISSKHRVISTEYNVITNAYNQIELGEKVATLTNNVVSIGDNVTSLKNDAEYTDKDYVVNFVAEQATIYNAIIKKAVINTLETTSVNISKSLSAAHGTIDELVANLLMAENATVRNILTAGAIRVRGHIEALSGEIGGCKIEDGKLVVSSSINITNDETEETKIDAYIVGSRIFEHGWLSEEESGSPFFPVEGVYYKINTPGEWYDKTFYWWGYNWNAYKLYNETKFEVDSLGNVTATSITITGNSINNETKEINKLKITPEGHFECNNVEIKGNIIALSGEIGGCKIEDGNLVVSSTINITNDETEETKIDTYIVGSVAFGIGWLSKTEGGTPLIPVAGKYYKINTSGEWYDKTFYWTGDGTNKYNLYNETKFEVDSLGNVTATSITITGNSINEETKEINELKITPEGHFKCNNVELKGNIIAESLDVKDFVKFNDLVKLTHTVSTATESQNVFFNASVQFVDNSNRALFFLDISSKDIANSPLNVWEDETFDVYVSYKRNGNMLTYAPIECTIIEESNSKYYTLTTTDIFPAIGTPGTGDSLEIYSIAPNSKLEEKYIDINVLSPDSHFGPEEDNTYDLGSSEKRWRDAFVEEINVNELIYTTLTQSSDRRLKKEINYDMSIFDKFFDTIKPVSYKYLKNNDSKIRLGFIAQDIAESLKLHNLNDDYALYSKKINKDSKHKEITDLSEDDYSYSLSYSELHAIEVRQIQLLKKHVEELEKRIKKLENEKDL